MDLIDAAVRLQVMAAHESASARNLRDIGESYDHQIFGWRHREQDAAAFYLAARTLYALHALRPVAGRVFLHWGLAELAKGGAAAGQVILQEMANEAKP
jgi:hypothetical protein